MAQYRSPEALANKKKYDNEYSSKFHKQKTVAFNKKFPEDIALFNWLSTRPEGGNHYIKRLIREDMEKQLSQDNGLQEYLTEDAEESEA